jgi:hypothetical protein
VGWRFPTASVERRTDKLARLSMAPDRTEIPGSPHNPHAEPNYKPIGQNLFRTVSPIQSTDVDGACIRLNQAEMKNRVAQQQHQIQLEKKLGTWPEPFGAGRRSERGLKTIRSLFTSPEGIRHNLGPPPPARRPFCLGRYYLNAIRTRTSQLPLVQ